MAKQHATEFEKIIHAGRERKRNEDLAARIFKRDNNRRSSAPTAGSLASRAGVRKRVSSGARIPTSDINGEWTHDLHNPRGRNARAQDPTSLAARIHPPGTKMPRANNLRNARSNRTAKLANAFERTTSSPASAKQVNMGRPASPPQGQGMSIRGLAGPYVVIAQNFAAGTTAADIESAMSPIGGIVQSCRLIKTQPIVIAEIVFEGKEGADRVVQTFNRQTADGRTLHVYLKPAGAPNRPGPPTGPRAQREYETRQGNNVVVDGSMGFGDEMDTDSRQGGLYSDSIVSQNQSNNSNANSGRRGRGFRSGR
ncbi:hypothetical protein GGR52DRAFT_569259 [Hypoxylon sp. FL1284]|nr:hypothetical protein GGR52DRAFT_569259 [Hypoxylon sp. FL1284]